MVDEMRHAIKSSEPLAAYWTVEDLPAMPRFLRELIAQAKSRLHVAKILVFGSRVRRDCCPTSDYDLAFVLEDTQGWARFVADQQEEAGTLLPLDLVNVHEASASLRDEIMASGVILYEK
jgi:predicted nucleotidyltransferase